MRCKKYIYLLSGLSIVLTMVFTCLVDSDTISTGDSYWTSVIIFLGFGIPMALIGLCWMLNPKDMLSWRENYALFVPKLFWYDISADTASLFGFFVLLAGIICTGLGILIAFGELISLLSRFL
jgi:hypothetical protein